jgi:flagella basal body P-ring formation protein FlgA
VDSSIRLADLCELRGFDGPVGRQLAELVVGEAPPPGGSRVIHLEMIRSALGAGGANMATVTLCGSTQCAVTRPSNVAEPELTSRAASTSTSGAGSRDVAGVPAPPEGPRTLRQAVIDQINEALARYGGRAEVVFDRTSTQALDLSGPTYSFKVRRRGNSPLGLVQLEVDVVAEGERLQTVPVVAQVSMVRPSLVARRSINQGGVIQSHDVELVQLTFSRTDKLGIDDTAQVIGQRAKQFISAGSLIDSSMIESVPLVMRGQLVTLTSVAGAVRVLTTAKAIEDGLLGETITVRAADDKRVEFDAVVVGPGAVDIGCGPTMERLVSAAKGGGS